MVNNRKQVGIFELTFLALLILKLSGVSDISWWWVFFPLLVVPIIAVLLVIFGLIKNDNTKQTGKEKEDGKNDKVFQFLNNADDNGKGPRYH